MKRKAVSSHEVYNSIRLEVSLPSGRSATVSVLESGSIASHVFFILLSCAGVCFAHAPDVRGGCLTSFCQDGSALLQTGQSIPDSSQFTGNRGFAFPTANPVLAQSRTEGQRFLRLAAPDGRLLDPTNTPTCWASGWR